MIFTSIHIRIVPRDYDAKQGPLIRTVVLMLMQIVTGNRNWDENFRSIITENEVCSFVCVCIFWLGKFGFSLTICVCLES